MAGEVLSRWERFVTHPVFRRYAKYAKEPAALFECIGEDLASSNQEIREIAFWALVYAMPKLASLLYEWETRQPGWREIEGNGQQKINRGTDILTHLHRKLVVERRFKIREENGKDPRPYVDTIIDNKKYDEKRKRKREVLLDYEATLKIPDPSPSLEDIVLEKIEYEECRREIRSLPFPRCEDEFDLLETVFVDHTPIVEVLGSNGIRSKRDLDQQFSRSRKKFVAGIFDGAGDV